VVEMNNKEVLNQFTDQGLELIEELILTTEPNELIKMIQELKQERKEDKLVSWNAKYKVEDMVLDWTVLQTLKKNNINTLQQLMDIKDLSTIPGITSSGIEQLEWAILFFDMEPLQKLHYKNPNMTQLDVAKSVVKQGEKAQKQMVKKYGHEV
jgi:hypothetical protein